MKGGVRGALGKIGDTRPTGRMECVEIERGASDEREISCEVEGFLFAENLRFTRSLSTSSLLPRFEETAINHCAVRVRVRVRHVAAKSPILAAR